MDRISFSSKGSFDHIEAFLNKVQHMDIRGLLEPYAEQGVRALRDATPVDSGQAASAWGYEITDTNGVVSVIWTNSDIENGFPVVVMLQYGHGTGTGGYVQGRDFINPAIQPIFDQIAEAVWRVVTTA